MAKLTKFTISPSGELVYKSTGKKAPEGYTFRKQTVYKKNGRRIGSLSRNLTRTEAERISRAERTRQKRQVPPARARPPKPRKQARTVSYGEDLEFGSTDFPDYDPAVKEEFAQRVRDAALSVAPPALSKKIRALTTDAIVRAYEEDQFIFELFFQYHSPADSPHKSDVSVWIYQFVMRIETYMGVTE